MGKRGKSKSGPKSKFGPKSKSQKIYNRVYRPEVVFVSSLMEILCEYQTKYLNLFNLSKEYDHKLLDAIACEIYQRCTHLINGLNEELTHFNFTRNYRKKYPHCDDLKFVQGKVWEINKQLGQPNRDITEEMLTEDHTAGKQITIAELLGSTSSILIPLSVKIESHLKNLDTSESGPKRVIREALKKQALCIQEILTETINETVMPDSKDQSYGKMRIYAEPYLPDRSLMQRLIYQFDPSNQMRSHRMYNCVLLSVPLHCIDGFLSLDGTVVGNARLVCRRSIQPEYRLPKFIVAKIKEFFCLPGGEAILGLDFEQQADENAAEQDGEKSDDSDDDDD